MTEVAVVNYLALTGGGVEVRIEAVDPQAGELAQTAAAAEAQRLHNMFNLFDALSPLNRWANEHIKDLPSDVVIVLSVAQDWFRRTGGAFHPATASLRRRWLRAEDTGRPPTAEEMQALADDLRELPFEVVDGTVRRTGNCENIDLNAVSKGFIVDRVARRAMEVHGVLSVVVDAAGDGRHLGAGDVHLPLGGGQSIQVSNAGFSSTMPGQDEFKVKGRAYSQVIDPRTGWPVDEVKRLHVVAADAMTADLLATALKVLPDEEALALVAQYPGALFWRVDAQDQVVMSPGWEPTMSVAQTRRSG